MHGLRFAPEVWIIHLCGPDVEEVHNSPRVLWRMAVQICSGNRDIACAVRLDDAVENIPVGLGVFQAVSIPLLRASQTQLGAFPHKRGVVAKVFCLGTTTTAAPSFGFLVAADHASLDAIPGGPGRKGDIQRTGQVQRLVIGKFVQTPDPIQCQGHSCLWIEVIDGQTAISNAGDLMLGHDTAGFVHGPERAHWFITIHNWPLFREHVQGAAIAGHHFVDWGKVEEFELEESLSHSRTNAVLHALATKSSPDGEKGLFYSALAAGEKD